MSLLWRFPNLWSSLAECQYCLACQHLWRSPSQQCAFAFSAVSTSVIVVTYAHWPLYVVCFASARYQNINYIEISLLNILNIELCSPRCPRLALCFVFTAFFQRSKLPDVAPFPFWHSSQFLRCSLKVMSLHMTVNHLLNIKYASFSLKFSP